jgi:glycosyltransferase involved in cell wall biosynthesis
MKICFIADGNSIHSRRWIEYFCKPGNEVHVISTTFCINQIEGCIIHNLSQSNRQEANFNKVGKLIMFQRARGTDMIPIAYLLLLLYRTFKFRDKARSIIEKLQPDLVHCLRLPIEGYIGGLIKYKPLVLTTYGNDMVYFSQKYYICRWLTRKAMSNATLYFADSLRDKYIAETYGFSCSNPTLVIPVTGGLKLEDFPIYQKDSLIREEAKRRLGIDPETNMAISLRGFKFFYVNTESLIRAIPTIIKVFPNTIFVLKGDLQLDAYHKMKRLAEELGVERNIRFTDKLSPTELADYLLASDIMASATLYDGCPVSMLEGMAYGTVPIMSIHSPIQEWINDGWNGYLIDPMKPAQIAGTFIKALSNKANFPLIRQRNWDIVKQRADYYSNMPMAEQMYRQILDLGHVLNKQL